MKTAKYKIQFEGYEVMMSTDMEITKKEFNRQLAFLRQQVKDTPDTNEYPVKEYEPHVYERSGFTETVYHFNSGCADTYLTALVCKPGYHFKK